MDPLYANLDKRNSSASRSNVSTPQPNVSSMPNFGQLSISSTNSTRPIISSTESAKAIYPAQPIAPTPTQPIAPKPVASEANDIILSIDQPKKSKKWIIFSISLLFVSVALIVTLLLMNTGDQSSEAKAKIASILTLIKEGNDEIGFLNPENLDEDEEYFNDDVLYATKIVKYGSANNKKAFDEMITSKLAELDGINTKDERIKSAIDRTSGMMKVLLNILNLNSYDRQVISIFNSDNENKAKEFIESQAYNGKNDIFANFSKKYTSVYQNNLRLYIIASETKCIKNNIYDYECVKEKNRYEDLIGAEDEVIKAMAYLKDDLELMALDKSMKNEINYINAELSNVQK